MIKKNDKTISRLIWENAAWLLGIGFAIINLYIANTILPLQGGIEVNASKIQTNNTSIEKLTEINTQVISNSQKIDYIYNDVQAIRKILNN